MARKHDLREKNKEADELPRSTNQKWPLHSTIESSATAPVRAVLGNR